MERLQADRAFLILRLSLLALLATGVVCYFAHSGLRSTLNEGVGHLVQGDLENLRGWADGLGAWAPLATFFLMVAQAIAAPIPAVLVTVTNSLLFGPFWGGVHSILSATVAAVICYLLASWFGDAIRRFVPKTRLEKAEAFVGRHGTVAILVARLIPIVPFDPISYVAGLARMRLWPFFWATLVGQIPAGMAYSYLAQQVTDPGIFLLNGIGVFLALLVLGWTARRALLGREPEPREENKEAG